MAGGSQDLYHVKWARPLHDASDFKIYRLWTQCSRARVHGRSDSQMVSCRYELVVQSLDRHKLVVIIVGSLESEMCHNFSLLRTFVFIVGPAAK